MNPPSPESVCGRDFTTHAMHGLIPSKWPQSTTDTPTQTTARHRRDTCVTQPKEYVTRKAKTSSVRLHRRSTTAIDADRDVLYGSFQALVHGLVQRYGDTPELREELKAEIYYRFCMLLDNYDKSRNIPLRPYIVCQLNTSVYTFVRQQRARKQRELPLELDEERVSMPFTADPSDQWDDQIQMREMCRNLPRMMQRLTLRQRQVVRWRYYEECSYEDIAGRLAVQPATARSILRHSLHNMRRMLEADGHSPE